MDPQVEETSLLMDAASVFLDDYNHNVTEQDFVDDDEHGHSGIKQALAKRRLEEEDNVNKDNNSLLETKRHKNNEKEEVQKAVVNPDGVKIDENICPHCSNSYETVRKLKKHLYKVHKIRVGKETIVKCNECTVMFSKVYQLRKHLQDVHNMKFTQEEYSFPNFDVFNVWKFNLEKKESVKFTTQGCAKGKNKHGIITSLTWRYTCNRSGVKLAPPNNDNRRNKKTRGSFRQGFFCTAAIIISKKPNENYYFVKYHPQHYGHLTDISSELLANKKSDITENSSGGDVFKNLPEVVGNQSINVALPNFIKKRNIQILREAFESEEYNFGLTDAESVDRWVRQCLQVEESPILYYKQQDSDDDSDDFLLVIMTDFQKQLLTTSEKKVLCYNCSPARKGRRFYLNTISIVDECEAVFPVAFCISSDINKEVVKQFLVSVKNSTGPLSYKYFISKTESFYFETWKEVMDDTSKWLWCTWEDQKLSYIKDIQKRAEIRKALRALYECDSLTIFESMYQKFLNLLSDDQNLSVKRFEIYFLKKCAPNVRMWAYCYHTDIKPNVNIQIYMLQKSFKFCCNEGRKTRLDKFIFVLMKFVKRKLLDRLANILDEERIEMVKDTINACHEAGMDISPECISSLSDKMWLVRSEEDVFVRQDFESCPDRCMLKCAFCDICVHMFSCTCITSMINANLCHHIHAVVWKLLTPHHFSPMASPTHDNNEDSNSADAFHTEESDLLESVLNMAHNIYKSVKEKKLSLNSGALNVIKSKLSDVKECIDVFSGGGTVSLESQASFLPCSTITSTSGNNQVQPIMIKKLQRINIQNGVILPDETQVPLPQDNSHSEPYIIYLPHKTPSSTETQK